MSEAHVNQKSIPNNRREMTKKKRTSKANSRQDKSTANSRQKKNKKTSEKPKGEHEESI